MESDGFPAMSAAVPRTRAVELSARGGFLVLLVAAPFLPELKSSLFVWPEVSNAWVCFPFCALFLLALADLRRPLRLFNLDLLVLGSLVIALVDYESSRSLAVELLYPPLAYLALRMLCLARLGRSSTVAQTPRLVFRSSLPWQWLLVGVIVIGAVHVHWALTDPSSSDVGDAGTWGAARLIHGKALYGADRALTAASFIDPHYDTYGPVNYEAYVPFVSVASSSTAARLMSLFFCLLSAGLLFVLGSRLRGPPVGLALAFAWLVYPFTLYSDGFDFNDALVAATLVGTLLVAGSPGRRGVMTALAGWTKLSPLALVPLMLAHPGKADGRRWRTAAIFSVGFLLTSILVFLQAFAHSSPSIFLSRSFGYQASRSPADSIWALLGQGVGYPGWVRITSNVVHGLLLALTVALAITLPRLPRRQDLLGLAAASAAVLIALLVTDGYFSFSYLLWFLPLTLVALTCDGAGAAPRRSKVELETGSFPFVLHRGRALEPAEIH